MCSHCAHTQYTIFIIKKENHSDYPYSAAMGFFSKGLKDKFKTAMVNEPSVFEPLKFYCIKLLKKHQGVPIHHNFSCPRHFKIV